jgi:hypothetical protein
MLRFFLSRYNRWSLVGLAVVVLLWVGIPFIWNDLYHQNLHVINWFLLVLLAFMCIVLLWDVRPAQDLALAVLGFVGGFLFEAMGTNTGLWTYFTNESPPLWVLPAWPVAALATARIAFVLDRLLMEWTVNWKIVYWGFVLVFILVMARFFWPTLLMAPVWAMSVVGIIVIFTGRAYRRDVSLMVAGMALGYFLEYWGTSRVCWTYYTGQTPPLATVMAHGFAQVVFARTLSGLDRGFGRLGFRWTVRARDGSDLIISESSPSCKQT